MNTKKKIVVLIILIIVLILVNINRYKVLNDNKLYKDYSYRVSDYNLLEYDEYDFIENDAIDSTIPLAYTSAGGTIQIRVPNDDSSISAYVSNGEVLALMDLDSIKLNKGLGTISYYPSNDVYYGFYKDVPVNLMIATVEGGPASFVGFADGSCYYPHDFDEVNNPELCQEYLSDILEQIGYNDLDSLLEDAFGDYITKN